MTSIHSYIENPAPLLASMCELFSIRDKRREVAILTASGVEILHSTIDNSSQGGMDGYTLLFYLPISLYAAMAKDKDGLEGSIKRTVYELLPRQGIYQLDEVSICPKVSGDDNWRERYMSWLDRNLTDEPSQTATQKLIEHSKE